MTRPELLILRGVPASGKTSAAIGLDDHVRVNRDDLRLTLFGKYWGVDEDFVTRVEDATIRAALKVGKSVVVDATNLAYKNVNNLLSMAAEAKAEAVYGDFPISLEEAIKRDTDRQKSVGADVIRGFFKRYRIDANTGTLPPAPPVWVPFDPVPSSGPRPKAYIIDTDGTVALNTHRSPYDSSRYHTDEPNEPVVALVDGLERYTSTTIIGVSGRSEEFREVTLEWWRDHVGFVPELFFMRKEGDKRNDAIVKYEIYRDLIAPHYDVRMALDDRPRVIRMWQSVGVPTLLVGDPWMEF